MSRRWRLLVIFLGLTLICISVLVLGYVFLPGGTQNVTATLQPTLFIAP